MVINKVRAVGYEKAAKRMVDIIRLTNIDFGISKYYAPCGCTVLMLDDEPSRPLFIIVHHGMKTTIDYLRVIEAKPNAADYIAEGAELEILDAHDYYFQYLDVCLTWPHRILPLT